MTQQLDSQAILGELGRIAQRLPKY